MYFGQVHYSHLLVPGQAENFTNSTPLSNVCHLWTNISAIPIIPKDEVLFDPSMEELSAGEKLFIPTHKHKIHFLKGAVYTDQLPQTDLPEVW